MRYVRNGPTTRDLRYCSLRGWIIVQNIVHDSRPENMKDRILIFGNGQLGNFYLDYFKKENITCQVTSVDITSYEQVLKSISEFRPNVVTNTAGKLTFSGVLNINSKHLTLTYLVLIV